MKRCKPEFPVYLCILFQARHTCKLQLDDRLVIVVLIVKLASVCVDVCVFLSDSGLVYYGTGPRTVIRNKQFMRRWARVRLYPHHLFLHSVHDTSNFYLHLED